LLPFAAASIYKAWRRGEVIFAVYGSANTALTLCWLESQVMEYGVAVLLLELATVVSGALLLWSFHRTRAARA
jgi:hypothetical protein